MRVSVMGELSVFGLRCSLPTVLCRIGYFWTVCVKVCEPVHGCGGQHGIISEVEWRSVIVFFVTVAAGVPGRNNGKPVGCFSGCSARLRVNGWVFCKQYESAPVQYVTVVNSWRNDSALLEELEALNVVLLWFSRDGPPYGLGNFLNLLVTMGDSFNPLIINGGFTLFVLGENCLRSFVGVVHSYFSL